MQAEHAINAMIQLRKGGQSRVGPDRIRLLEVIGELGSISAAAKTVGLSYKGAWDAVQAMNNLFERPLVVAQPGGKLGGAASITPVGQAVVLAYRKVEADLSDAISQLEQHLSDGSTPLEKVIRSLSMKTSARNALRGVVQSVAEGAVNSEVTLKISEDAEIVAIVTRESIAELGLAPGREAVAIIKSSFVILAKGDEPLKVSARNRLVGTVARHDVGAVNDEVVLDIGGGKSITATITRESGKDLQFAPGERGQALIKASHVILAVD
ncbi:MAG TPA: TOBE domain-containing protein [Caulobacteraceae bacterium]|nr:TOBE domain-containing protein [Caulobacteraceae bacterium]